MPLSSSRLESALAPVIETQVRSFLTLGATPYPRLTSWCQAMAKAIAQEVVSEIVNNATLSNAKFSGTFPGTVSASTSTTVITDHPVTGGIA